MIAQRVILLALIVSIFGCGGNKLEISNLTVQPSLEDRTEDGDLYNPSTQSLLRTHSKLEKVNELDLSVDRKGLGELHLSVSGDHPMLSVYNLPMTFLVPRLHYSPSVPPDAFDAYNLMMAEFARNSISVPAGADGDKMAHFQTSLENRVPWRLEGDFEFQPNPDYRPLRFGVINNCLSPGLWEVNAIDRTGEVYHGWFQIPIADYHKLVADANGIPEDFVQGALGWKNEEVKLDLDRLRRVTSDVGSSPVTVREDVVGFSSQDSRRKLHKHYAVVERDGQLLAPEQLDDFYQNPVQMSEFIEPGKYSLNKRKRFDFTFLKTAGMAQVSEVEPLTSYFWRGKSTPVLELDKYIEVQIPFENNEWLIIGNLPLDLLVKQEDYVIHGFGVGILSASGLAERRNFLIKGGPSPSFAYLARKQGDQFFGLNSHDRGIEQIFIRTQLQDDVPNWEITITSYERIVDLVKYRVPIPDYLIAQQVAASLKYISPLFYTYKDDNIN